MKTTRGKAFEKNTYLSVRFTDDIVNMSIVFEIAIDINS